MNLKANEKRARIILQTVTVLMWFSIYSYQSGFTPYLESLNTSAIMIGFITGSYGLMQMILRVPFGIISDRLKTRRLFIITGITFTFISAAIMLFTENIYLILFARASAGIAASTWVNFTVLYSSYFKKEEAVGTVGVLNFYSNTAQLCGMVAGSLFIYFFAEKSYRLMFLSALVVGLIGFACSFFIYEDKGNKKDTVEFSSVNFESIKKVLSDKTLILVSFIGTVSQLVTFATVFSFTPKYAADVLKAGASEIGVLTVVSYLPSALGSLFLGKYLVRKFKEKTLVFSGMLLLSVFTVAIPFTGNFTLLVITQIISGIGKGISFPLLMGLSIKNIDGEKRGTAMGMFQAIYALGMFIGPAFAGIISQYTTLNLAFIVLGLFSLAFTFLSFFLLKRVKI